MNKFEITKGQIEKLSTVCHYNEITLKEWFPEAFKSEIEVGKWYKYRKCLYYVTKINYNTSEYWVYGFDYSGNWNDEKIFGYIYDSVLDKTIEATKEEIQEALLAEAKRRGYKEGVTCKSLTNDRYISKISDKEFCHLDIFNKLWFWGDKYNLLIFKDGKWAEIIEDTIEPIKGKWYWSYCAGIKYLMHYKKLNNSNLHYAYAYITETNNFYKGGAFKEIIKEATDEEVLYAFEQILKNKGFKEGVSITNTEIDVVGVMKSSNFELRFDEDDNIVMLHNVWDNDYKNYEWTIYNNGKLAEIVEKPKRKMTVAEICNELGEEIEIIK